MRRMKSQRWCHFAVVETSGPWQTETTVFMQPRRTEISKCGCIPQLMEGKRSHGKKCHGLNIRIRQHHHQEVSCKPALTYATACQYELWLSFKLALAPFFAQYPGLFCPARVETLVAGELVW